MNQARDPSVLLETRRGVLIARPGSATAAPHLRERALAAILSAMPRHRDRVVLDLTELAGTPDHGVPLALGVLAETKRNAGSLAIATEDEIWAHILRLSNLAEVLPTCPTVDEALDVVTPQMMQRPANLLVMISGGGRSLLNLLDAIDGGTLRASVAGVIASANCPGAEAAASRGLLVEIVPGIIETTDLAARLSNRTIDLVVLAGYLKKVRVPDGYRNRILNIHPSLLPKFGGKGMHGLHVHRAVLAANEHETGCTVHYCDDEYDSGRVILQRSCPVHTDDTPEMLATRVFAAECLAYPEAIRCVLRSMGFEQPDEQRSAECGVPRS